MKGALLWLLGLPIPVIILLYVFNVLQRRWSDTRGAKAYPSGKGGRIAAIAPMHPVRTHAIYAP